MTDDQPGPRARAAVEALDEIAAAMERKWGVDRLPRLVGADLADRFASQRRRLDDAVEARDAEAVAVQAAAMGRAWRALDAAASAAGWKPVDPTVWEFRTPAGRAVALVRDEHAARCAGMDGRTAVWTLDEIGRLIDRADGGGVVADVKTRFPGARVRRSGMPDPSASIFAPDGGARLPPIDWSRGDDIPF